MKILPPISFRKRDKDVVKLIRRGFATHDELFEAQFGEWSVRGLEKDTPASDIVRFKGFGSDKNGAGLSHIVSLGYTKKDPGEDSTIYLNQTMLSPLGHVLAIPTSRMAFARVHDLIEAVVIVDVPVAALEIVAVSLLTSYRYAIASSLVKLLAPSIADVVGEEQIHTMQLNDPNPHIASAAFQASANDWLNNQSSLRKAATSVMQFGDAAVTLMPRAYYAADFELQARLHNVISRGYKKWGRIPSNKDELYAAMLDMGIKSPAVVKDYFNRPEQEALNKIFNKHSGWAEGYTSPPNAEMNLGLNSYRARDVLEMYWQDCLPYLYGDLLVKYGDSKGMEKMGFAQNETDILGMPLDPLRIEGPAP